jgi:MIP family channel proteins
MTLRAYLLELVGTFCLVFLSAATLCGAYAVTRPGEPGIGLVGIAVAQGAALAALLTVSTRVSDGCLNPAVTLALWVTRRFDLTRTLALVVVQLVGAALAGGLITAVFDQGTLERSFVGTPHLKPYLDAVDREQSRDADRRETPKITEGDWIPGTAVEAVTSFVLTVTLLAAVIDPRRPGWPWGPLVAGLALTACVLASFHLTGAAVNPARWFGTAVWQGTVPSLPSQSFWTDHLPYWMGPTVGALVGALAYAEWLKPAEKKG